MAFEAFESFLNIDGISGGSADPGHAGWSDIESFDYEMAQTPVGPVSDPAAGQIRFADFTAVKVLDRASPKIYEACCNGHLIKNVVVELWWAGDPRVDDERQLEVGRLFPPRQMPASRISGA